VEQVSSETGHPADAAQKPVPFYETGVSQIPLPQKFARSLCERLCRKDLKVERISNPVDDVKIDADIYGILDCLVARPRGTHRYDIILPNFSWIKRQLFQKTQCCPQFFINRCRAPIVQYSLDDGIAESLRRDRAVTTRSKGALVLARDKRREKLAFANAPIRGPAHHSF
jgi:hypothetical protein